MRTLALLLVTGCIGLSSPAMATEASVSRFAEASGRAAYRLWAGVTVYESVVESDGTERREACVWATHILSAAEVRFETGCGAAEVRIDPLLGDAAASGVVETTVFACDGGCENQGTGTASFDVAWSDGVPVGGCAGTGGVGGAAISHRQGFGSSTEGSVTTQLTGRVELSGAGCLGYKASVQPVDG